jgi:hypothetical protein
MCRIGAFPAPLPLQGYTKCAFNTLDIGLIYALSMIHPYSIQGICVLMLSQEFIQLIEISSI